MVSGQLKLEGFVDADWANNITDRKSTSGFTEVAWILNFFQELHITVRTYNSHTVV